MALTPGSTVAIERRLGEVTGGRVKEPEDDHGYHRAMIDGLKRMGNVAPRSVSEMGKLQQRLVAAGYRSNEALIVFFGIRLACALLFFAVLASPILMRPSPLVAIGGC